MNELRANKIIHINNFLNNKNLLLNVSICLLPKNINECLNIGSSIYSYKSKRKINNITFIFSQNLIVKHQESQKFLLNYLNQEMLREEKRSLEKRNILNINRLRNKYT